MNIQSRSAAPAGFVLLATSFACSDDPVNLGAQPLVVDRSQLSAYVAEWDGYIEAFVPENSGSDRVHLSIGADGAGALRFGEEPAPASLDELNVLFDALFPPGIGSEPTTLAYSGIAGSQYPIEGFDYSLREVLIESERIRFEVQTEEPAAPFCEAQAPVPATSFGGANTLSGYSCGILANSMLDESCVPGLSLTEVSRILGSPNPDLSLLGDLSGCKTSAICISFCECSSTACAPYPIGPNGGTGDLRFDGALEGNGDRLVGTLNLMGTRVNARFERQ
jgi:hypothetical protein